HHDPGLGREFTDVVEDVGPVEIGGEPHLGDPAATGQKEFAHRLAALDLLAPQPLTGAAARCPALRPHRFERPASSSCGRTAAGTATGSTTRSATTTGRPRTARTRAAGPT